MTSIPNNIRIAPNSLAFLIQADWWKSLFACARAFAPRCIMPAVLLTLGNLVIIGCNAMMSSKLLAAQKNVVDVQIQDLIIVAVVAFGGLIVFVSLSLFALSQWLVRLTAFARALSFRRDGNLAPPAFAGMTVSEKDFDEAIEFVRSRKGFLAQFWLLASAYAFPPCLLFATAVGLGVISRPEWSVNGERLVPMPDWLTPSVVSALTNYVGPVAVFIAVAYCMVALVFAACAKDAPWAAANRALLESIKHPVSVAVVTVVVAIINLVITSPFAIAAMIAPSAGLDMNPLVQAISYVWLGVTSTVIWPASVAPFCMIVADDEHAA